MMNRSLPRCPSTKRARGMQSQHMTLFSWWYELFSCHFPSVEFFRNYYKTNTVFAVTCAGGTPSLRNIRNGRHTSISVGSKPKSL